MRHVVLGLPSLHLGRLVGHQVAVEVGGRRRGAGHLEGRAAGEVDPLADARRQPRSAAPRLRGRRLLGAGPAPARRSSAASAAVVLVARRCRRPAAARRPGRPAAPRRGPTRSTPSGHRVGRRRRRRPPRRAAGPRGGPRSSAGSGPGRRVRRRAGGRRDRGEVGCLDRWTTGAGGAVAGATAVGSAAWHAAASRGSGSGARSGASGARSTAGAGARGRSSGGHGRRRRRAVLAATGAGSPMRVPAVEAEPAHAEVGPARHARVHGATIGGRTHAGPASGWDGAGRSDRDVRDLALDHAAGRELDDQHRHEDHRAAQEQPRS